MEYSRSVESLIDFSVSSKNLNRFVIALNKRNLLKNSSASDDKH